MVSDVDEDFNDFIGTLDYEVQRYTLVEEDSIVVISVGGILF